MDGKTSNRILDFLSIMYMFITLQIRSKKRRREKK